METATFETGWELFSESSSLHDDSLEIQFELLLCWMTVHEEIDGIIPTGSHTE